MRRRFFARPSDPRAAVAACAVAVALLATAACGSHLSHDELVAAARDASASGDTAGAIPSGGATAAIVPEGAGEAAGDVDPDQTLPGDTPPDGSPSSTDGETTPGPGSAAAARSCTKALSQITIAAVGQQSGVVGSATAAAPKAVQAWASAVNARGGLACHPVRYLIADDGGDPSRHQALVRQMVEQEGAIAFVDMNAPLTGEASIDYLESKQIPVVGSDASGPWVYTTPIYFPQAPSADNLIRSFFHAAAEVALPQGKTKVATLSCIEAPACSRIFSVAEEFARNAGLQVVSRGQGSLVQPDFTSACQSAQRAGAEIFIVALDSNSIQRVARSCASVNFRPIYTTASQIAGASLASDPNLDGMAVGLNTAPWMTTSNAGVQEFLSTLKQYAPGLKPDATSLLGWTAAKLFELAARDLPENPTSEDVLKGLYAIRGDDLKGLTTPLSFTRGQPAPQTYCYWLAQVSGGKYISPNNGERKCP